MTPHEADEIADEMVARFKRKGSAAVTVTTRRGAGMPAPSGE